MPHPLVVDKRSDSYDIAVTRPSKWGSPFPAHEFESREECVRAFDLWVHDQRKLLADLHELRGVRLGCVCAPRLCHADVLARMANNPFVLKAFAHNRLVITGSRHWDNDDLMYERLSQLKGWWVVGHGDSPRGADRKAAKILRELGHLVKAYPVDTRLDGQWPYAGLTRNQRMLDSHRPHLVIGFRATGKSNGTDDCLERARWRKGVTVDVVHG